MGSTTTFMLRGFRMVVAAAVRQSSRAVAYASKELQADEDFIRQATLQTVS